MKPLWLSGSVSVVTALVLGGCSPSTPVTISNRATVPLEDLVISGSGFDQRVGTVAPGQTVTVRVMPVGESGLSLAFHSGARPLRTPPQGYFEGGGNYKVSVVIASDLRATVNASFKW